MHWALRTAVTMGVWEKLGGRPESEDWFLPNWGYGPPGKFMDVVTKVQSTSKLAKKVLADAMKQFACTDCGMQCERSSFENDAFNAENEFLVKIVQDDVIWDKIEAARKRRREKNERGTGQMGALESSQKRPVTDMEMVNTVHGGRLVP